MYPLLEVHLDRIRENAEKLVDLCGRRNIDIVGVVKGCTAFPEVAKAMLDGGIRILADARIDNVKKLRKAGIRSHIMLIRIPMLSEIKELVELTDICLVSEAVTIKAINDEAGKAGKRYRIILMIDMGDLREGIWPSNLVSYLDTIRDLKHVELWGLGTNLGCFGGVIPTPEVATALLDYARFAREYTGFDIPVVSMGGTVALFLVENGEMPEGINQLRIGEAILLGKDTSRGRVIPYLRQDTFILKAEIIELKVKPSVPIGEVGVDGFGKKPEFVDKGLRKRAIVALGKHDVMIDMLSPLIEGVEVLGGSSDHTILDITDSVSDLRVGDIIPFEIGYGAMMLASSSPYVRKAFIGP